MGLSCALSSIDTPSQLFRRASCTELGWRGGSNCDTLRSHASVLLAFTGDSDVGVEVLHMSQLTPSDLKELTAQQTGLVVSVYMPTHRAGQDNQQDPIRLKNLLQAAEERLVERGMRRPVARDLLAAPRRHLTDGWFWRNQSEGLAVFVGPQFMASHQLPLRFEELFVVDTRFYLKPLLSLMAGDGQFYVLALSQNAIRLLKGTQHRVRQLDLEEVPHSLAEALQWDQFERSLQFRSATGPPSHGQGAAIFYGHADDVEQRKSGLARYLQAVDHGLCELLAAHDAPVVLAGVTALRAIYREVSHYRHLVEQGIDGNPDDLRDEALHQQAWQIVQPIFGRDQEQARARYRQLVGTGRTSARTEEIVPAAWAGRVEVLFVASEGHVWGAFDPVAATLRIDANAQADSQDLLDLAAVQTFLNGGAVYAIPADQIPEESPVAAILRYG